MLDDNRRIQLRLGSLDSRKECTRFLEQSFVQQTFKLPRVVCCPDGTSLFQRVLNREKRSGVVRQCYDSCLPSANGGIPERTGFCSTGYSYFSYGLENYAKQQVRFRENELESRPVIKSQYHIRVDVTSQPVSFNRSNLGATSDRSFCVHVNDSARDIQLDVLGPVYLGGGRIRTKRLDQFKQLCQRSLRVTEQSVGFNSYTQGFRNCDRAILARSGLVSKVTEYGDRRPNQTTSVKPNSYRSGSKSGTVKEQGMDHLCLETLWGTRLRCLGWTKHAATRTVNSLADSTLRTYNSYIKKYISFCTDQNVDFSNEDNVSVLSEFLCQLANKSQRPESMLKTAVAAVACLFEGLGKISPTNNSDIKRLVTGLVKTQTFAPMCRSKPMPIQPFINLFTVWGDNSSLSVKQLRLKSITLLALVCMNRPSDLAPRGVKSSRSEDSTTTQIVLSLDNIVFCEDGSMTIHFWGIKNDTTRSGFEVNIPPNVNTVLDPVQCLKDYIHRTDSVRPRDTKPLFLSLNPPYEALKADTAGNILEDAIQLVGLR